MNQIYAYALVFALKEQQKDLLDTFLAFVLKEISREEFLDADNIKNNLRIADFFKINIPIHVLNTILKRAKKHKYVEAGILTDKDDETKKTLKKESYRLTAQGFEHAKLLDGHIDIQNQIDELCSCIKLYFRNNNNQRTDKEIYEVLLSFIQKSIAYFDDSEDITAKNLAASSVDEKMLANYMQSLIERKDDRLKIIKEMLCGSILSAVLCSKNINVSEIEQSRMKHFDIFFDTNFLLYLFNLSDGIQHRASKELFDMLRNEQFKLNVFDLTVQEVQQVIRGYEVWKAKKSTSNDEITDARYDLYRRLEFRNWSVQKASDFRTNLANKLTSLKINIVKISPDEQERCKKATENIKSELRVKKPKHSNFGIEHDLTTMEMIRSKYRDGKKILKLESAKAIFLTSDIVLSKFNYEKMGHNEDGSICEVMLDRFLSNILWLKNPKLDAFPLEVIIAANSRDVLVNRKIWEKFTNKLKELCAENRLDDIDLYSLLHNNYIDTMLLEIDEEDAEHINWRDYVENAAKNARAELEKQKNREIEQEIKKWKEMATETENKVIKKDEVINHLAMRNAQWDEKASRWKEKYINEKANEKAKEKIHPIVLVTNIVFIGLILLLFIVHSFVPGIILLIMLGLIDFLKERNLSFWGKIRNSFEEKERIRLELAYNTESETIDTDAKTDDMEESKSIECASSVE